MRGLVFVSNLEAGRSDELVQKMHIVPGLLERFCGGYTNVKCGLHICIN